MICSTKGISKFGEEHMSHAMPAIKNKDPGEISSQEYEEMISRLRKIHSATGHCSRQYLIGDRSPSKKECRSKFHPRGTHF